MRISHTFGGFAMGYFLVHHRTALVMVARYRHRIVLKRAWCTHVSCVRFLNYLMLSSAHLLHSDLLVLDRTVDFAIFPTLLPLVRLMSLCWAIIRVRRAFVASLAFALAPDTWCLVGPSRAYCFCGHLGARRSGYRPTLRP